MKLSLKVEYALRVLAQLGRYHGGPKLAHIEELAEAESVPSNYLVQILNELRNGGVIISRRGKQGGYALAKEPEAISLFDVMSVIDPGLFANEPSRVGQSGPAVANALNIIGEAFEEKARSVSVRDLMPKDAGAMYYI
ncbi:MAG: RrF2 family transcriptional regulator [Puniceicoccales bacterium]